MGLNGARAGGWYMAWQQVGSRCYYYRNQYVAGRSVRRYVGTGPVAELAAAVDDLRRLEHRIAARERAAARARVRATDQAVGRLFTLAGLVARATPGTRRDHKQRRRWGGRAGGGQPAA